MREKTSRDELLALCSKFRHDIENLKKVGDSAGAWAAYENYAHCLDVALEGTPSTCDATLQAIKDCSPELLPS